MFTAKRVGDPRDYIKGESGDWEVIIGLEVHAQVASNSCLLYTSPSPRDGLLSRMPSSA